MPCRALPSSHIWAGATDPFLTFHLRHSPWREASKIFSSSTFFHFMFRPILFLSSILTLSSSAVAQDTPSAEVLSQGQQTYMQVCFACHQPTGLGLPNMFPPLASSDWVAAPKPDRLIRMVLHGMTGPIKINGQPFTTPAPLMPPQGAALTDEQIASVLSYVRNSFGNQASMVTAAEVKAIREAEKARTAMWTEAELEKIPVH